MTRVIPAVLWLMAILVATLTPGDKLPESPDIIGFDKLVHLGLFLVLTFLWNRAGTGRTEQPKKTAKIFTNYLVFGLFFAIFIEFIQRYIPGRSFDQWDFVANITGGTLGTICFYILHRRQSNLV